MRVKARARKLIDAETQAAAFLGGEVVTLPEPTSALCESYKGSKICSSCNGDGTVWRVDLWFVCAMCSGSGVCIVCASAEPEDDHAEKQSTK